MKGTILKCLGELVVSKFGKEVWEESLFEAGLPKHQIFLAISDIDDGVTVKVVQAVCKSLDITLEQAADAFGDYWVNVYSQMMYGVYYKKFNNSKDFLLNMDNVHISMTKMMKNAKPPRFEYDWVDNKTLIIHYKSHRGLIDFVVGLVKGVGKFYNENLIVKKISADKVKVIFE